MTTRGRAGKHVEQERAHAVRAMFDRIAPTYDLLNRVMTLRVDQLWRRKMIRSLELRAGQVLLEMSNPDVQLEALTAQQQLVAAEGQLVSLRTQLETARLNQAGLVAQVRTQLPALQHRRVR